ncbi:CopY/TcrY family copper transport repressor [Apilactobacillus apisilvae]|uniref:CopY/TcrY family copper transport repressor n=1 Tax=Apilactobacillus apisilvae TaxID=2923364 RepID=A0ABY4PGF6_9LACO|nr:CopY/TcrY family copper transport repressor [Apilactobacillus apisilvae]UQS84715.1 CopY/TcrY family copper transport repressor [Apilactobacillus apisilvae]
MNNKVQSISNAEWEVMRILWTLGNAKSKTIIDLLTKKNNWSESTIKTLITRLKNKKIIGVKKEGNKNFYYCLVDEDEAYKMSIMHLFKEICCMQYGSTLDYLINNIELSKNDIDGLIKTLEQKKAGAPDKVECKCLGGKSNEA